MPNNLLLVIIGMSGGGKSSLSHELCDKLKLSRLKTTTTRPKRNEEDNEYEFVSDEYLKEHWDEYTAIRSYHAILEDEPKTYYYGISKASLEEGGIMITDVDGLKELYATRDNVVGIYLYCSYNIRKERAKERDGYKEAEFERREKMDGHKFGFEELIKLGIDYPLYIIDNSSSLSHAYYQAEGVYFDHLHK